VDIAVVATHGRVVQARATVRSVLAGADPSTDPGRPVVLATCRCYRPVADELVLDASEVGESVATVAAAAAVHEPPGLERWLLARLARHLVRSGRSVLTVRPGVELLGSLDHAVQDLGGHELGLVARTGALAPPGRGAGRWESGSGSTVHDPDVLVLIGGAAELAETWCVLTDDWRLDEHSVDVLGGLVPHATFRGTQLLVSPSTMPSDQELISAAGEGGDVDRSAAPLLDLSAAHASAPWLFDAEAAVPQVLLSAHPALAATVEQRLAVRREDNADSDGDHPGPFEKTSSGAAYGPLLRELVRSAVSDPSAVATTAPEASQRFDPFSEQASAAWRSRLLEEVPAGHPRGVSRYLSSIWTSRPDLQAAFPRVPGPDSEALLSWSIDYGATEAGYDGALLQAAFARRAAVPDAGPPQRRPHGVNLVGYLTGELGIGESARLVRTALEAVDYPVVTKAVSLHLTSRQDAPLDGGHERLAYDTTLLCVNAAQAAAVTAESGQDWAATRRIGYWYWEVEAFPAAEHAAFEVVDEIWVATDFVRDAIAPHSPVPVVTMTPPLWRDPVPSTLSRADLGLPSGRPVVLFVFDYLSTAERKNPWGAVAAFRQAYPPGTRHREAPILVIKSINARHKVRDAERLRLLVAGDPDVLLLEHYMTSIELQALMAACDVYLSLHRSEGLGLTMAEAMSLGKPVVATAYSGNLQFMDETNSYLVPWSVTEIPPDCEPYPAGATWADPDLDEAARLLRTVLADPDGAREVGQRGATSLRTHHSAHDAGRRMTARLEERGQPAPGPRRGLSRFRGR